MNPSTQTTSPRPSRLDSLIAKRDLLDRQLKAMAAQQQATKRKTEQRAKFLLGEAVLTQAHQDPALLDRLCAALPAKHQALIRSVTHPN